MRSLLAARMIRLSKLMKKASTPCLEVPGFVLEAALPHPIKWNYVASPEMCVVKIAMANTGATELRLPKPASGRSRSEAAA